MRRLILPALVLLCLCGCSNPDLLPYAREVENMTLMRVLGMDRVEGGIEVTASSGVQSKGADEGEQPPRVMAQRSRTVSGACLAMQAHGTEYVFYGHVERLVLGELMARESLREALDYIERDPEMRLDTGMYVIRGGSANEAIGAVTAEGESAAARLEALEDDAGAVGGVSRRTVRQVLTELEEGASYAPALLLSSVEEGDGDKEEIQLSAAGYAIFDASALVGWAEGAAAAGIELLTGQVEARILELPVAEGEMLALRVVGAKSKVRAVFEGDSLTGLKVTCAVEANLAQAPDGMSDWDTAALEELRSALEETERARIAAALALSQELKTDFLGLKKRAGLAAPWRWAAIQAQWAEQFPALDLEIVVEGTIQRSYDVIG